MTLRLTDDAEDDIRDALDWYAKGGRQLRDDFRRELDSCFQRLQTNPLLYSKVKGDIRRALLHRFPYAVLYIPASDEILILAVLHERREPDEWKSRPDP